jgi:predicted PurR-regulated permease PerM
MGGTNTTFWIFCFLMLLGFVYLVQSVLLPFVAAAIIAYLLDPVVDKLEKKNIARGYSAIAMILLFFVGFLGFIAVIAPMLYEQFVLLLKNTPDYIRHLREEHLPRIINFVDGFEKITGTISDSDIKDKVTGNATKILSYFGKVLGKIWQSSMSVINLFGLIFITPVIAFYFLRDWDKMVQTIMGIIPIKRRVEVSKVFNDVDTSISGFLHGQLIIAFILGTFYSIALTLAGLDYGLLIGVTTGILSFIPYVGTLVGFAASIIMAFIELDDMSQIAVVAGIFIFGQFVEGNFLSPKIVGDRVGLHPVWIIFGLMAGGAIAGFTGILLGVPLTAAIAVFLRFFIGKYKSSAIYLGS